MVSRASALGSVLNAAAESVGCQLAIDMYPAIIQMTRNDEIFTMASASCSIINANAESAGWSPIGSRYLSSGSSNNKK